MLWRLGSRIIDGSIKHKEETERNQGGSSKSAEVVRRSKEIDAKQSLRIGAISNRASVRVLHSGTGEHTEQAESLPALLCLEHKLSGIINIESDYRSVSNI